MSSFRVASCWCSWSRHRKTPIELLPHKSLLLLLITTSPTCSRAWIDEFLHWLIGYMHWRLGHHLSRTHPTKMMLYVDALPPHNHHGMGGNNHARDDPFAKV